MNSLPTTRTWKSCWTIHSCGKLIQTQYSYHDVVRNGAATSIVRIEDGFDVAIWKYPKLFDAFITLIVTIAQTEVAKNLFDVHSQYQSTSTQAVLNKIGSQLRFLSEHSSDAGTAVGDDSSEVVEYEKAVLTLCSQLIHCVDHPEVHNGIYQIVVSGLADKTPSLVVLPCLVDIALVDGVERQNDVNGILTGLLMNVDLHNVSNWRCV